ncbi:hypothetical protein EXIGLDRAFT_55437, partial [Exidia glandulosa HHB12029]
MSDGDGAPTATSGLDSSDPSQPVYIPWPPREEPRVPLRFPSPHNNLALKGEIERGDKPFHLFDPVRQAIMDVNRLIRHPSVLRDVAEAIAVSPSSRMDDGHLDRSDVLRARLAANPDPDPPADRQTQYAVYSLSLQLADAPVLGPSRWHDIAQIVPRVESRPFYYLFEMRSHAEAVEHIPSVLYRHYRLRTIGAMVSVRYDDGEFMSLDALFGALETLLHEGDEVNIAVGSYVNAFIYHQLKIQTAWEREHAGVALEEQRERGIAQVKELEARLAERWPRILQYDAMIYGQLLYAYAVMRSPEDCLRHWHQLRQMNAVRPADLHRLLLSMPDLPSLRKEWEAFLTPAPALELSRLVRSFYPLHIARLGAVGEATRIVVADPERRDLRNVVDWVIRAQEYIYSGRMPLRDEVRDDGNLVRWRKLVYSGLDLDAC